MEDKAFLEKHGIAPDLDLEEEILRLKKERNAALLKLQAEISAEVHAEWVGRTVDVLVEEVSMLGRKQEGESVQLSGRTGGDLITHFEGSPEMVGQLVQVKVERSAPLALYGALV